MFRKELKDRELHTKRSDQRTEFLSVHERDPVEMQIYPDSV